ncbi:MAG: DJ-1/PfpI family protein [Lachnospiraceae bacterium]|nr:DJ-1/PfpI family protein [Lachnospiraceae bacterium]
MEKVYVFLADGFEEIEGLTVVDVLRRGKVDTVTVSVSGKQLVMGSHKIPVMADCIFEETDLSDGSLYVLPGGMPGTIHLDEHQGLTSLLADAKSQGKRLAAICAAPSVLGRLGLLKGETATCHPGFEDKLEGADVTENTVEVSGQITTSRGMGTAVPFALKLLEQLRGTEAAEQVRTGLVWNG